MSAQPGWYPDPAGTPMLRWWDGSAWTNQMQSSPVNTRPPSTGNVSRMVVGIVSASLVLAAVIALTGYLAVVYVSHNMFSNK